MGKKSRRSSRLQRATNNGSNNNNNNNKIPRLLKMKECIQTTADFGEFQPWFRRKGRLDRKTAEIDVVLATVHGPPFYLRVSGLPEPSPGDSIIMDENYNKKIRSSWDGKEELSVFLETYSDTIESDYCSKLIRYKIALLRDDENLNDRLDLLGFYIVDKKLSPPNVLDAIRWRQCGVLRWMVAESFVDLRAEIKTAPQLERDSLDELSELKKKRPLDGTELVEQVLCFMAVVFDDLQTLQWLVTEACVSPQIYCFGMNLLHLSCHQGREEIACWLVKNDLVPVSKPTLWGQFACHLAIERGHVDLAQYMIENGCRLSDSGGRSIIAYAKRSDFEYVVEWGRKQEENSDFAQDLSSLHKLLFDKEPAIDKIKLHIAKSKCLWEVKWAKSRYEGPDDAVIAGSSYMDMLDRCVEIGDTDFVLWLHDLLLPETFLSGDALQPKHVNFWISCQEQSYDVDWYVSRGDGGKQELLHLVEGVGDNVLHSFLPETWEEFAKSRKRRTLSRRHAQVDPVLGRLVATACSRGDKQEMCQKLRERMALTVYRELLVDRLKPAYEKARMHFVEGSVREELEQSLAVHRHLVETIERLLGFKLSKHRQGLFDAQGRLNLDFHCGSFNASLQHFAQRHGLNVDPLVFTASEGRIITMKWLHERSPDLWNQERLCQIVKVAAFFGNDDFVDWLVWGAPVSKEEVAVDPILLAALLGYAEAGNLARVKSCFLEMSKLGIKPSNLLPANADETDADNGEDNSYYASSPLAASVNGLYTVWQKENGVQRGLVHRRFLQCIEYICSLPDINSFVGPKTAERYTCNVDETFVLFLSIFKCLSSTDVWENREDVERMCTGFVDTTRFRACTTDGLDQLFCWIRLLAEYYDVSIQNVLEKDNRVKRDRQDFVDKVRLLQAEQQDRWNGFERLAGDSGQITDFTEFLTDGVDAQGLRLVHCAAANDRLDVVKWLVITKNASITDLDKNGRTVMDVAVASNATNTMSWLSRQSSGILISTYLSSMYRRNRVLKETGRKLALVKKVQACWRGYATRHLHLAAKASYLESASHFRNAWGLLVAHMRNGVADYSWEKLRHTEFNLTRVFDEEEGGTIDRLESATSSALSQTAEDEPSMAEQDDEPAKVAHGLETYKPRKVTESIKWTKDVEKWRQNADSKFAGLFSRRMKQLSAGDRSRILMKPLVGCTTTIFETYLEQKSGHRILWTPCVEDDKTSILVWYVARHKKVPHYMRLIDDAQKRSAGYDESKAVFGRELELDEGTILLDPMADVPLKLYQIRSDELSRLEDKNWTPNLRLTPDERHCVEREGTTLLLGRSGTGKTICICSRMSYDRSVIKEDVELKQLFVARSKRICKMVQEVVEDDDENPQEAKACVVSKYLTFKSFIRECNTRLRSCDEDGGVVLLQGQHVDFNRYKLEFYSQHRDGALDPLVIWTQIRSFIKGSIEAVLSGRAMEEEEYLGLGKNRCRLGQKHRRSAYDSFKAYQKQLESEQLWDDCDMVSMVLKKFRRVDDNLRHEIQYDRIYVDEIQDYTQSELALFFLWCSQGGLFLAGDTAQSVVEGVTFRFEDLRSVAHSLYGGDRRYIPDKPLTVTVNFRSHEGVLKVAAAILERMFTVFPGSANKLPPDTGIFNGPRPGYFKNIDASIFLSLLKRNEGVVVLTHDEHVSKMQREFGSEQVVLGIRAAKGLEFSDVMIVDFFSGLSSDHQKPWKTMLQKKDDGSLKPGFPELESQLKLLYTGITRCSKRLFFVETTRSVSGEAFLRFLADSKLAESLDASSVENVMTPDEWRSQGVEYGTHAETADDLKTALEWLGRALHCFERAEDSMLARKARAHVSSVKVRQSLELIASDASLDPTVGSEAGTAAFACAKEGLLLEAFKLVTSVLPSLDSYAQQQLREEVLSKLTQFDD